MTSKDNLRGSCSCGRYNYVVTVPKDDATRSQAYVHFGTGDFDRRSHASVLSAWLKVPLTWYRSTTISYFPDERHEHIARTFRPAAVPASQRKFCGFCGTHISYWTEQPESEQEFMNITLGSLGERDLLALEDLDLLPADEDLRELAQVASDGSIHDVPVTSQVGAPVTREDGLLRTSKRGNSGGISWFEDLIQGSQLGQHSKRRRGYGTSADGSTMVQWEISEFYGEDDESSLKSSKRKAGQIATDDTDMIG